VFVDRATVSPIPLVLWMGKRRLPPTG
jgi:hypothetical protein